MNKYDPLYNFLIRMTGDDCVLSFSRIEEIIGDTLPLSARGLRQWWGNQHSTANRPHCQAWTEACWQVGPGGPNFREQTVRFIRRS